MLDASYWNRFQPWLKIFAQLYDSTIFSIIDLFDAYLQLEGVDDSDQLQLDFFRHTVDKQGIYPDY